MKKLPKKYIILEIIPTNSQKEKGFIAQLQALKICDNRIVERLDIRVNEDLIVNEDLLHMISYDKEMFKYVNKDNVMPLFLDFIENYCLLIIDNDYTKDYLDNINNKKVSVFNYLDLVCSNTVFDELIKKYNLEYSNHLVDLLYEALMFETDS